MQNKVLYLVLVSWISLSCKGEEGVDHDYNGNIPHYIQPLTYSIGLKANLRDWKYSGRTQVLVNITEPCDQIPIHSDGLNISAVFLASFNNYKFGRRIPIYQVIEDKSDYKFLRIFPEYRIAAGLYVLIIDFENFIIDELFGFYKTKWVDSAGWVNKMAATHFSPDKARMAWPCFDEPRLKARFKFFIEHESVYDAISNTEVESRKTTQPGWVRTIFKWTPPMSTYITALIITNYRYIEGNTDKGVRIRVYGDPSEIENSEEELGIVTNSLEFFESYFGTDYPLSKLYLMPVPDIGVGAMENWGLITSRYDIANFNRAKNGAYWELIRRVVITHEVAHMWFGNLVTHDWWDSIMLKEGMVTWFMYFAADKLYDDFDHSDEFAITNSLLVAMNRDGYVTSRPIIQNVKSSSAIISLFDEIAYHKGGMVLRMLYHIIGPDPLQRALNSYIVQHEYSTAQVDDFIQIVQDVVPEDMEYDMIGFMNRYTKQKNFPLVHVRLLNKTHCLVSQERFLYNNESAINDSPFNYTWHIPFTYTTDTHRNDKVQMLKERENIVKLEQPSMWIKANNDFRMFYRTTYDLVNWKKLYHQLVKNHLHFSTSDRTQLLDDLLHLAKADRVDITFPLQFLTYLKNEREYGPWYVTNEHLRTMDSLMSAAEKFTSKIFLRMILDNALSEAATWNASYHKPVKERLMQFMLLDAGIRAEHPVAEKYIDGLIDNTRLEDEDPDLNYLLQRRRAQIDGAYWDSLLDTLPSIKPEDYETRLFLLSSTQNKTALWRLLLVSINDTLVPKEIRSEVISNVAKTDHLLAWDFFSKNYDAYFKYFGNAQFTMNYVVTSVIEKLDTVTEYNKVKQFFEENSAGVGEEGVRTGLESIMENVRWKHNFRHKYRAFFYTFARKSPKLK